MSPPITLIAHPHLTYGLSCPILGSGSTGFYIGGQVPLSISTDTRRKSVRTLVNYRPMSDRNASMHDQYVTDVIDIGRTI